MPKPVAIHETKYRAVRGLVTCPKCGSPCKKRAVPKSRCIKGEVWACSMALCEFSNGYRITPARNPNPRYETGLKAVQGPNTLYAVPFTHDFEPALTHAVLWPRFDPSELPRDPEEQTAAA